jgi:hypothetical protein
VDPQRTVQRFVDLVGRHEGSFYNFVHQVHAKGQGVFDDLMKWIEHVINFVRDGLPKPIYLEFILPHSGPERAKMMEEVDTVIEYHRKLKEAHHQRMRRRMIRGEGTARDEDAAFVEGVMDQLSMGEMVQAMGELDAEDSDEERNGDSSSEELLDDDVSGTSVPSRATQPRRQRESVDSAGSAFARMSVEDVGQPSGWRLPSIDTGVDLVAGRASASSIVDSPKPTTRKSRRKKDRVVIEPPQLVHVPQLVPIFVEMVRPALERASRRQQSTS